MSKSKEINQTLLKIEEIIQGMEKQFGKGILMRLGDEAKEAIPTFSTGSLSLNHALGIGGLPRGRIAEIYGQESCGKTTLALHCIAEVQKAGGIAAFIDAEHALDIGYAARLNINVADLLLSQPDSGEQALDIVEALVKTGSVDLIVVDSVAALTPRAEIEGEMGEAHVGLQARLMSQALRKLTPITFRGKTTILFINQTRMKIGVMFGNPETTTGGNALKFYSSVRLEMKKIGNIEENSILKGTRIRTKVVKNKVSPPFKQSEFDIIYGEGISTEGEILDLGEKSGLIKKNGSWFTSNDQQLGQGREQARAFLKNNSEIRDSLCREIWNSITDQTI
jgi:recombination protein RecA